MKLSTLMVVNAIIAAVFGVAFVVVPGQLMSLYGPEVTLNVLLPSFTRSS